MGEKKGVPQEIIEELDIHKKKQKRPYEVNVIVEHHQAKIPIPKSIRASLKLEKGAKCVVSFDENKKEMICKFK